MILEKMWQLLVVCLLAIDLQGVHSESCQNGDVRLAGEYLFNATAEGKDKVMMGRLEVFLNGQWGTVCEDGFTQGAAQSVCHQLGYTVSDIPGTVRDLYISEANDSTPILLSEVDCQNHEFSDNPLDNPHILRCQYTKNAAGSCDHSTDVAILCYPFLVYDFVPYKTQVRLLGGDCPSSGELGVFVNKMWGSACYTGFTKAAADSACRQLGYTNAVAFMGRPTKWSEITWIQSTTCSNSQPCLKQCFKYPSTPVQCPDDKVVFLNCTFDVSNKDLYTAGNEAACKYTNPVSHPYVGLGYFESIGLACGAVAFVIIVCLVTILVVVLCVCLRKQRNPRYVTLAMQQS